MRKVVQLTVTPEAQNWHPLLFALCDDGTVWVSPQLRAGPGKWSLMPPVPQEAVE